MMGSVSRPNRARATCPTCDDRPIHVVDRHLSGTASRMGICVIRAGGRLPTCPDACTIEPRLDVGSLPESLAGTLSLALSLAISALRVLRPIQRNATPYKPFSEIPACDRAGRDGPAIRVEADWNTIDGTAGNEGVKVVRRLRTATILQAVFAAAQLTALRCIDTPKPDTRSMYFQRIAVDHASLSDKIVGQRHTRQNGENQSDRGSKHSNDVVAISNLADWIWPVLEWFLRRQVLALDGRLVNRRRGKLCPNAPLGMRQRRCSTLCQTRRDKEDKLTAYAQGGGTRGKAPAPTIWNPCSVLAAGTD